MTKFLLWGALLLQNACAFSLLGPYADWMDDKKGYRYWNDIGGPMNFNEGYRWNIPVITYGFERSFLDYFGSDGVAAVEEAIQLLNQLPPASQVHLQNYSTEVWRVNFVASAQKLMDLKSAALHLFLEQLGLADPVRYAFCIRELQEEDDGHSFSFVIKRNFDPATGQSSSFVNGAALSYFITQYPTVSGTETNWYYDAQEFAIDPTAEGYQSVARGQEWLYSGPAGYFATNLSRDDVGGLKFLLNSAQVRFENLLPDIRAVNTNSSLVRGAFRPGIEKIAFVRHPFGTLSGEFRPFTNRWTDLYYLGNEPVYQEVERVSVRPDIVFSARDLGINRIWERTGTTNWVNNADFNGNWGGAGPGVIQPPIEIALNNAGQMYLNYGPFNTDELTAVKIDAWGSFAGSTNTPVVYPAIPPSFHPSVIAFHLASGGYTNMFSWTFPGGFNRRHALQTSAHLDEWTDLATFTNSGATFTYEFRALINEAHRFFRLVSVP